MTIRFNPAAHCILYLNGKTVRVSLAELGALRELMPVTAASPAKPLLAQLLATGLMGPYEDPADTGIDSTLASCALSPYLLFDVRFSAGEIHLGAIEPSIGLFLPPEFVHLAQELSDSMKSTVSQLALDSVVRGVPFRKSDVKRFLEERVEARLGAADVPGVSWSRGGPFDLRLPQGDLRFSEARILVSLGERKADVRVPMDALPALARVLDRLRTGAPIEAVSGPVRRIMGAVARVGGFIERSKAPPPLPPPSEGFRIVPMGHACLIVEAAGRRVLVDPWLFAWDDRFVRQPVTAAQMGQIDAIFYTHHHTDHMEAGSLLSLPHDVPVFIPPARDGALAPRLVKYLELMGFADVREFPAGSVFELGGGAGIEAVPFYGEGNDRLGFPAICFLAYSGGRNALFLADSSPDHKGASLVSSGDLERLVQRRGPMDVVFGTWWQDRRFLFDTAPLAIFQEGIRSDQWLQETEWCNCSPEYVCGMLKAGQAKLFVTYAESGPEGFLPPELRSDYIPQVSFLWETWGALRDRIHREVGIDMVAAEPHRAVSP